MWNYMDIYTHMHIWMSPWPCSKCLNVHNSPILLHWQMLLLVICYKMVIQLSNKWEQPASATGVHHTSVLPCSLLQTSPWLALGCLWIGSGCCRTLSPYKTCLLRSLLECLCSRSSRSRRLSPQRLRYHPLWVPGVGGMSWGPLTGPACPWLKECSTTLW
jgi:hypothetical protein